ncbi:hypothetical protein CASFOL_039837 [Castilleja foliolosa]|uniref:Uncharacterized protein n=1 Tax=Castilleja foliolosa TaxID=1961234 RepID=A0ABD3BGR0_9LAMI
MEELPGALGTSASLALRLGQAIFAVASLLFMCLDVEFYSYTAFCLLGNNNGVGNSMELDFSSGGCVLGFRQTPGSSTRDTFSYRYRRLGTLVSVTSGIMFDGECE